jgi:GTPase SAR1 family protein
MIGSRGEDEPVTVRPHRANVLITGPSGSGKSTLTTAILEQLKEHGYQFLLVDPEGDYDALEGIVVLGSPDRVPTVDEVMDVLSDPRSSLATNLLGVPLGDRPGYLETLLPRLQELRAKTGRPHWVVVDEAHHLLPSGLQTAGTSVPTDVSSMVLVTVHADALTQEALEPIALVVVPAKGARESLEVFAETAAVDLPDTEGLDPGKAEAAAWFLPDPPFVFQPLEPSQNLKRHRRKYAQGDLEEDAFFFRGPEHRLDLRAQNLQVFSQIAQGVDDETWAWHLERGDYERWFRDAIGDEKLAELVKQTAGDGKDSKKSRRRILEAIEERYTLPAESTGKQP